MCEYPEDLQSGSEGNDFTETTSEAELQTARKRRCDTFFSGCFRRHSVEPELDVREGQYDRDSSHGNEELSATAWASFRAIFRVSTDNKLAWKLFGTKDNIIEEQKRQQGNYPWVMHPYSSFRWYWDFFMVLFLLITVIALPVSISFYHDDTLIFWFVLNCITDFIFLVDIVFNFRTGIVVVESFDQVILEPSRIARQYMKGWFCIDLVSSIPFDYFTLIVSAGDSGSASLNESIIKASRALRILRITKLLSLLRLLRVSRLFRYVQRWEELFNLAGGVIRIVNLIGTMLLLSHWNGCIQFLVPYLQGIPEDSWISINRLEDRPVSVQYTWALFKAMSHMLCIGYGRFPPQTVSEVWMTILSMMTGATFYALFIGHMSSLLMSSDTSGRLYKERWAQMLEYLRYRKIPTKIGQRVKDYYEHRYQRKFFDETSLLNNLSPPLRADIISHNCRSLVKSVPFFQEADNEFLTHILAKLTFEVYLPGDVIIQEGMTGDSMYFIQHGVVEVSTHDGSIDVQLAEGSYFGEVCLLTDERRVATIRAVSTCDLFTLLRHDFTAVVGEYPEVRHMMETVALHRLHKFGNRYLGSNPPPPGTPPSFKKPDELSRNLGVAAAAVASKSGSRRLGARISTAAKAHRRISSSLQAGVDTSLPTLLEEGDETGI